MIPPKQRNSGKPYVADYERISLLGRRRSWGDKQHVGAPVIPDRLPLGSRRRHRFGKTGLQKSRRSEAIRCIGVEAASGDSTEATQLRQALRC